MTRGIWKNMFGENLATILREKNISQNQLSKDSGLSKGMISDYINKSVAPTIFAIVNIAYALDVSVDELVDFGERVTD